ncbi:3-oxoacyl-(acyl-carrier-protein) synthase, KASII [Liberibacter crescens BT-1]|uniref:3-oxoacyl-(Acyl-carrier-protein) synthase, KASII n=1 Tax=Liberibacter crescens (strain BT-1) TaxID=1215343 RepID=L0EX67_LIBCB|nr:beta-ketoacyl-ACP synthase [Liberibacter crescens]AGA64966.1 3-oxoacyl-(acyl-carrier-protein) synthase, KASII [Liberibacter crescens BT-1]AMC12985.1 3-oxoacyl-ACP synthase [Liberibacter crescens]
MNSENNNVVITGIGIVTSQGIGVDIHSMLLSNDSMPVPCVEKEKFSPYPIHPFPEIDWSEQIPKRTDQRQMGNWQRSGVYAAGLALEDAGLKGNIAACDTMDLIVAAGGGERDIEVDTLIVEEALKVSDRESLLNKKLMTELRPTLFLSQLSNLLAGNISIIHKVTGSSDTFMGEEGAAISAIKTASMRIMSGQSRHVLVGSAFFAERMDIILSVEGIGAHALGDWQPVWSRNESAGGGIILGSAAVFLLLESFEYAQQRGAYIYARLNYVEGDRGSRDAGFFEDRFKKLIENAKINIDDYPLLMSGASGMIDLTLREMTVLQNIFRNSPIRGYSSIFGHTIESQFVLGVALAAISLGSCCKVPIFHSKFEKPMLTPAYSAIVTTVGHQRGEGVAALTVI